MIKINKLLPFIVSFLISPAIKAQFPERDLTRNPISDCLGGPHCVSSLASDPNRKIESIQFTGDISSFKSRATLAFEKMPRTKIIRATDNYLHVEFTSAIMGFTDDFEIYLDPATNKIDLRSSSRVGYYDLGANGRRVKSFRQIFLAN